MSRLPKMHSMMWSVVLGVVLLVLACGKKGPPVAPDQPRPPRVEALTAEVQGLAVTLHWIQAKEGAPASGYGIYRAATALEGADCADCPLLFQKHGQVAAETGQSAFQFRETVKPGFRYTYKVRPETDAGTPEAYSDVVSVQVLP